MPAGTQIASRPLCFDPHVCHKEVGHTGLFCLDGGFVVGNDYVTVLPDGGVPELNGFVRRRTGRYRPE